MFGFMPFWLRAYIFILIAQIGAIIFMRVIRLPFPQRRDCAVAWLMLTAAAFFGSHFALYALVLVAVCFWLRNRHPDQAVALYLALLPVIPLYSYELPGMLGITYFLRLDNQRLLTLALLLPALLVARRRDDARQPLVRNAIDATALMLFAWLILMAVVHRPSATDKLRGVFETSVFMLLPYLVVSRLVRRPADLRNCILAIAFGGLFVAMIGLMEQRMTAYFYQNIPYRLHMDTRLLGAFASAHDLRFGLLRIKSSIDGGLGYFLVICLAACLSLGRLKLMSGWRLWAAFLLLSVALFFTGARGPWIMAAIVLMSTWAFGLIRSPGRFIFFACLGLLALPTIGDYFMSSTDRFGTFSYRAELLRSTLPLVGERPWMGWGSLQALFATGRLEHMRQGQGIIDLVNVYLGVAVESGIPAFLLICALIFACLWTTVQTHARRAATQDHADTPVAAFLVTLLLGTAFFLSTISFVGHVPVYFWTLIALCSAYSSLQYSPVHEGAHEPLADPAGPATESRQPGSVSS